MTWGLTIRSLSRVAVFAIAFAVGVAVFTPTANAAWGDAPFSSPYADDWSHSHVTMESNPGDAFYWQGLFDLTAEGDYEPTDLSVWKRSSYISWIDVYWFATVQPHPTNPNALGTWDCMSYATSTTCDRGRIKIKESARYNYSNLINENLLCHEFGHGVGFRDFSGFMLETSCMNGGDNAQLSSYERGKINGRY